MGHLRILTCHLSALGPCFLVLKKSNYSVNFFIENKV